MSAPRARLGRPPSTPHAAALNHAQRSFTRLLLMLLVCLELPLLQCGTAGAASNPAALSTGCVNGTIEAMKGLGLRWGEERDFYLKDRLLVQSYLTSPAFEAQRAALAALPDSSRGILIPAGGRERLMEALGLVRVLRELLGCSLPVEVVHNGAAERDAEMVDLLSRVPNVRVIDGSSPELLQHPSMVNSKPRHRGFVFKIWALTRVTSFRHVLLLDADNTPLVPPQLLWGLPQVVEHGNLHWPDFLPGTWSHAELFRRLGLPNPWERQGEKTSQARAKEAPRTTESGQVVIDRARHADVLEWLWYLNAHPNQVYHWIHGDKDTFRMAFQLAGKVDHFQQVMKPPRHALYQNFGHLGMVQHLPDGTLAFHHRTHSAKMGRGYNVKYITEPLTQEQAEAGSKSAWSWKPDAVDTESWKGLGCSMMPASEVPRPRRAARLLLGGIDSDSTATHKSLGGARQARALRASSVQQAGAEGQSSDKAAVWVQGEPGVLYCQHNAALAASQPGGQVPVVRAFPLELFGAVNVRMSAAVDLFNAWRQTKPPA